MANKDIKKYIIETFSLTPEEKKNIAVLRKEIRQKIGCNISRKETHLWGLRTLAAKFDIQWDELEGHA